MVKFANIASALFAATALVSARVVAPSDEARSLDATVENDASVEKRDVYGSGTLQYELWCFPTLCIFPDQRN